MWVWESGSVEEQLFCDVIDLILPLTYDLSSGIWWHLQTLEQNSKAIDIRVLLESYVCWTSLQKKKTEVEISSLIRSLDHNDCCRLKSMNQLFFLFAFHLYTPRIIYVHSMILHCMILHIVKKIKRLDFLKAFEINWLENTDSSLNDQFDSNSSPLLC